MTAVKKLHNKSFTLRKKKLIMVQFTNVGLRSMYSRTLINGGYLVWVFIASEVGCRRGWRGAVWRRCVRKEQGDLGQGRWTLHTSSCVSYRPCVTCVCDIQVEAHGPTAIFKPFFPGYDPAKIKMKVSESQLCPTNIFYYRLRHPFNLFIFLTGVLRPTQDFFSYTTAAGIMIGADWSVPRRNPPPSGRHSSVWQEWKPA